MKHSRKITIILLAIFLPLVGCVTYYSTVSSKNMASIYNPSTTTIHPDYLIFRDSDSTIMLISRVFTQELLFNQANAENSYKAQMKIHYRLFDSYQSTTMLDSGSVIYVITKENAGNEILSYIPIRKLSPEKEYILEITTSDLIRNRWSTQYQIIQKKSINNPQNFLIAATEDNTPIFRKNVDSNDVFYLKTRMRGITKLYVDYFRNEFPLPPPPFSSVMPDSAIFLPDSSWVINFSEHTPINCPYTGTYRYRVDTTELAGFTVFNFGENYPYFRLPENLVQPLQYLTTTEEFAAILQMPNKKIALDNFWLKTTGNMERSKELIRIFYNRAFLANIFFASYTEGWKTDRGMIYTVFGEPAKIYLTETGEKWSYGQNQNMQTASFTFFRVKHPICGYEYVLDRNSAFKGLWYDAVDTWRNGRAYLFGN